MAKMISVRNCLREQPEGAAEFSHPILETDGVRVSRTRPRAKVAAREPWQELAADEWVMMARGGAVLEFEGDGQVSLRVGDHLMIPRRKKHRVILASRDAVWVAVRLKKSANVKVG